jgi:predicted N-acyltransferase
MGKDLKFVDGISSIKKSDFDILTKHLGSPFMNYDFLSALEQSNCVSKISGWQPKHLASFSDEKLNGFMPLYLKDNSQGEFVFDHSWSYALNRTGRNYYPKLVTAIPFTPCETEKIIGEKINSLFINEVIDLMNSQNIETWHILFPNEMLKDDLQKNNFIERNGYKFVWENKTYNNFDDYLNIFKSRQRKNIRTERKKISELDIYFEVKDAKNLTESDWNEFYTFYKNTYEQRLQIPYLNRDFFKMVHENRESIKPVIFFANIKDKKIAGSLCFESNNTLYGRHWGSIYNIDSLHFECCYYQGIEYCIKNKISRFDPGVQGEHKIRRGFEPMLTSSYHYIKEQDFFNAINDFCLKERKEIKIYLKACERYTPFKKGYKI